MGTEVDVFISNYTLIDDDIYEQWINGRTASEAVTHLVHTKHVVEETGASLELVASEVLDHFRTYSLLEKLLCDPNKLQEQLAFQIHPETRLRLIERYYDFDDEVARELIGKKLSSKHRKDLDEVAEKTGIPLKSCRRQFDNVKRVFKQVEDLAGSVVQNIQAHFYLGERVARKYACVVFLACIRFETSKRRLNHLRFPCWKRCTEAIMDQWTNKFAGVEYFDTEIDKDFFLELREIKVLLEKEREHKHSISIRLKPKLLHKTYTDLETNFKNYNRTIIALATSMHRPRDVKNMFLELSTLVDSFKQASWGLAELELFLNTYTQTALEIDLIRDVPNLRTIWEKYMNVIIECLLAMHTQ